MKHQSRRERRNTREKEVEEEKMPTFWFALKRSLHCKSEPSEVHDPKARGHLETILTRTAGRSGCSRSMANLKDVIHGSKRHLLKPPSCSPRSSWSSKLPSPITHEVVLSNPSCELRRITGSEACHDSTYVATVRSGTTWPGLQHNPSCTPRRCPSFPGDGEVHGSGVSSLSPALPGNGVAAGHHAVPAPRFSHETAAAVACHKCGKKFVKWQILEAHHLSKHAGINARKCFQIDFPCSSYLIELIGLIVSRISFLRIYLDELQIERVLKIHNMQRNLAQFEEYRETIKTKAGKLPKKHPRCLADGNEHLRFHGAAIACSLGSNGSSSLCTSERCSVCQIIRHGFSSKKESKGRIGVFTTSTCGRALESIETREDDPSVKKALLVCRVIAGRVHKPLDDYQELVGRSAFDSIAGKIGIYGRNIEELYLLNPSALLPCFVVIWLLLVHLSPVLRYRHGRCGTHHETAFGSRYDAGGTVLGDNYDTRRTRKPEPSPSAHGRGPLPRQSLSDSDALGRTVGMESKRSKAKKYSRERSITVESPSHGDSTTRQVTLDAFRVSRGGRGRVPARSNESWGHVTRRAESRGRGGSKPKGRAIWIGRRVIVAAALGLGNVDLSIGDAVKLYGRSPCAGI
ncbi:hypothetical protein BHE74_00007313 [Ensete ventricosum]|nr:hypothetical protein BHE74_00007313 [Ensete ventricosum]RZR87776.1 hypothetical protein BHM03_00015248 [Ensete ventricosum]